MQKFFLKPPSKKKKINEIRGVFSEIAGFTTRRNERKIYLFPNFSPIILLREKLLKKLLKKYGEKVENLSKKC